MNGLADRCLGRRFAGVACGFLILTLSKVGVHAADWPQWRGPKHDGISTETNLPTRWSKEENLLWTAPLPGMGSSTPAVWRDRIFVTSEEGNDLVLLCFDQNGKQLWKTKLGSGRQRYREDEANNASPSPSTDGKRVYAFFGSGDFGCCDFDGNVLWHFNAQDRYGRFEILHGMHVTPLLHGDRLYLSLLHGGGQWVVCLDTATGNEVWKVQRPTDGIFEGTHSYASPILWRHAEGEELVVHGCDYTTGHRLSDGAEIWRLGDLNDKDRYDRTFRIIASPTASGEILVVPTCKAGPVVAIKAGAKGKIAAGSPLELWRISGGRNAPNKTPDVPCPLIHEGLVYLVRQYGRDRGSLICVDLKTGQEVYQAPLHPARYRASPVLADGKIYLVARDGTVTVVRPGRQFEKLAEFTMDDQFTATPAVAHGRLYLRGFKSLYAVGKSMP
jgi:outer membrane protein assembly factor BamB